MTERMNEIQARLAAINSEIETAEGEALTALENESRSLLDELNGIQQTAQARQARQALRASIAAGAGVKSTLNPAPAQPSAEERAAQAFAQSFKSSSFPTGITKT